MVGLWEDLVEKAHSTLKTSGRVDQFLQMESAFSLAMLLFANNETENDLNFTSILSKHWEDNLAQLNLHAVGVFFNETFSEFIYISN